MSLVGQLGRRFRIQLLAQGISAVVSAALIVVLARLLGPDEYGLLFLAIAVLGTVSLLSKLGIAKSTARYVSLYKETDEGCIPHILATGGLLTAGTIAVTATLLYAFAGPLARLVGAVELIPYLQVGVAFVVATTLFYFAYIVLQGFEAIEACGSVFAANKVFRFLVAIGLVVAGYGALGALVGYVVGFAITAVVGLGVLYVRYYRPITDRRGEVDLRGRIARYSLPVAVTDTADVLDRRVDTILVGFFLGPVPVAFYELGKQVIQFLATPAVAAGFTAAPTYEAQRAQGKPEVAARMYEEALAHIVHLYIPAAVGLILVAAPMVEIVFGPDYAGAVPVIQVLAFYLLLRAVTKLTSDGLDYLGQAKSRAYAKSGTAVANVALNIVLIPWIGVVGAAIATVMTYGIYAVANVYIISREFDLRWRWLSRQLGGGLLATAVMGLVVLGLVGFVGGPMSLLAIVIVGVFVWAIPAVGLGMVDLQRLVELIGATGR